jgi:quercetin dioxygenase-like cupin family protein
MYMLLFRGGFEMRALFVTLAVLCLWTSVLAQEGTQKRQSKAPLMVSLADLKWTDLPERKGMQFAVLSGDPKKGEYTQMRKVPAGTDNPLHIHSSELKNVIISGVWYTGADAASAKDFGPGSVIVMPANWVHVSGCRAGSDCVFYQGGKGKFDFKPASADK